MELQKLVLNQNKIDGIAEYLIYDVLNPEINITNIRGCNSIDPTQVVAYPSFEFFSESLQDYISQMDYTVITDENFDNLDSLIAFDANGIHTKILNYLMNQ